MELIEPPHNTCLRHDYTANLQLISRPLDVSESIWLTTDVLGKV